MILLLIQCDIKNKIIKQVNLATKTVVGELNVNWQVLVRWMDPTLVTPTWKAPGRRGHSLLSKITQFSPFATGSSRIPTKDLYLRKTHSHRRVDTDRTKDQRVFWCTKEFMVCTGVQVSWQQRRPKTSTLHHRVWQLVKCIWADLLRFFKSNTDKLQPNLLAQ